MQIFLTYSLPPFSLPESKRTIPSQKCSPIKTVQRCADCVSVKRLRAYNDILFHCCHPKTIYFYCYQLTKNDFLHFSPVGQFTCGEVSMTFFCSTPPSTSGSRSRCIKRRCGRMDFYQNNSQKIEDVVQSYSHRCRLFDGRGPVRFPCPAGDGQISRSSSHENNRSTCNSVSYYLSFFK